MPIKLLLLQHERISLAAQLQLCSSFLSLEGRQKQIPTSFCHDSKEDSGKARRTPLRLSIGKLAEWRSRFLTERWHGRSNISAVCCLPATLRSPTHYHRYAFVLFFFKPRPLWSAALDTQRSLVTATSLFMRATLGKLPSYL